MRKLSIIISVLAVLAIGGPASGGSSQEVKKADLAGQWYSADKKELAAILENFIDKAPLNQVDGRILGLISPHAGYNYSGNIAGIGFRAVKGKGYKTIVIIGFSHRKFFNGISVYNAGRFQTPLGEIEIDTAIARALINQDKKISFYPDLFTDENSVEMIIPFVQISQPGAKIVPIAFGSQSDELCDILAGALKVVIKDREDVLIIASTDMSHFHPYGEAEEMDGFTVRKLQELNPRALYDEVKLGASELCGVSPVVALMLTMRMLGADNIKILGYENSGDITGDKRSVVGYMSAVFYKNKEGEGAMLNEKQKRRLLEIARGTIEAYVKNGKRIDFTEADPELLKEKGAFVTLHYRGDLRGCIGNIIGKGPLYKTVRDMAIESSTNDPRFPEVSPEELKDIKIEISVLSVPERVSDVNKLVMGTHGVIVKRGFNSGVFLPQVATETGWAREEFLNNLCAHKAGLSPDAWKDPRTEIYSFTAEVFGEE